MYWLVQGCKPGDSLVFHFSGHGPQQINYDGDELDGYDETLCPLDSETEGEIVDDEINDLIAKPLTPGVKLHAIIDACHSGTVLDLPFLYRMNKDGEYIWEGHQPISGKWKGTNGGVAISFSGCDDHQTSADGKDLWSLGAMTCSFIGAVEQGHGSTFGSLLTAMRSTIRDANTCKVNGGRRISSLLKMLLDRARNFKGDLQEPQLTANKSFDVYSKHFFMYLPELC